MSVYFAASGDFIKIGYSAQVMQRIASLRSDYSKRPAELDRSLPITLLGWYPGDRRNELLAHAALNDHWAAGEWYRDCEAVRAYLAAQPEVLMVEEVSAQALFAVINGATVNDAKAAYPLSGRAAEGVIDEMLTAGAIA